MPKFVGFINHKQRVIVEGRTLVEAMATAGYTPLRSEFYASKLVGCLTTGERFSFRLASIENEIQFRNRKSK